VSSPEFTCESFSLEENTLTVEFTTHTARPIGSLEVQATIDAEHVDCVVQEDMFVCAFSEAIDTPARAEVALEYVEEGGALPRSAGMELFFQG
jgi:hypothetical protein